MRVWAVLLAGVIASVATPGGADTAADADALVDAVLGAGCILWQENSEAIGQDAGLSFSAMQAALPVILTDGRAEMPFDGMVMLTSPDCHFGNAETLAAAIEADGCIAGETDGARIAQETGLDRRAITLAVRVLVWQERAKSGGGTLTLISGGCE